MEPKVALPCSQEISIGHYPEPDESSPYKFILSLKIHLTSSNLRLDLPSDRFPSSFQPKS
jgi:hypothetical protein